MTLLKFKFLKFLRNIGILKKNTIKKNKIKIQSTVLAKPYYYGNLLENEFNHLDFIFANNKLKGTTHILEKDKKSCGYNFITHTCRCGISLERLRNGENCPLK